MAGRWCTASSDCVEVLLHGPGLNACVQEAELARERQEGNDAIISFFTFHPLCHTDTDTHAHTHMHTHAHKHTYSYTYAFTQTQTHTHTHTRTHIKMCVRAHKHTHNPIKMRTQTQMHVCIHTQACSFNYGLFLSITWKVLRRDSVEWL